MTARGDVKGCDERARELLAGLRLGWSKKARAHNLAVITAALEKCAWDAGYVGWKTAKDAEAVTRERELANG